MNFNEIFELIDHVARNDYESYVKAIIAYESNIFDMAKLDEIYINYLENDYIKLLNPEILKNFWW